MVKRRGQRRRHAYGEDFIKALEESVADPKLLRVLNRAQTLVLNANFTPINMPIKPSGWKETIKNVFLNKVDVIEVYDSVSLRSPSIEFFIPSIVANKRYVKHARKIQFTKANLCLRDDYTCQYCGVSFPSSELTYDHVVPTSMGGRTEWTNIVMACDRCNGAKSNQPPGKWISPLGLDRPLHVPIEPTYYMLEAKLRKTKLIIPDARWNTYLGWEGPVWVQDPVTGKNTQIQGMTESVDGEELGF